MCGWGNLFSITLLTLWKTLPLCKYWNIMKVHRVALMQCFHKGNASVFSMFWAQVHYKPTIPPPRPSTQLTSPLCFRAQSLNPPVWPKQQIQGGFAPSGDRHIDGYPQVSSLRGKMHKETRVCQGLWLASDTAHSPGSTPTLPHSALTCTNFTTKIITRSSRAAIDQNTKTRVWVTCLGAWCLAYLRLDTVFTAQQGMAMPESGVMERQNSGVPLLASTPGSSYCFCYLSWELQERKRKGNSLIPFHPLAQSG